MRNACSVAGRVPGGGVVPGRRQHGRRGSRQRRVGGGDRGVRSRNKVEAAHPTRSPLGPLLPCLARISPCPAVFSLAFHLICGFFSDQPGKLPLKSAETWDLPLIARSARELSRSARDLNTKCRSAQDLTQSPGLNKMVERPGTQNTNERVDQPGILTES